MKYLSQLMRKYYFFKYNIIPFRFSLVLSHTIKRITSLIGIKKGFRIIDLALTYDCNLSCQHCSAMIMQKNVPSLTLDDYKSIVKQSKRLDVLSWNITGGEPLVIDWLEDLIPVLEPKTHYISIQTNCMLLDEKTANKLARLGVNCITTSLDSINPEEHNAFRGSPQSYRKVFEGIRNARKAGMQALVGGTITHQNLRSLALIDLIEQTNQEGVIFLFNLAIPCGNWQNNTEIVLRGDDRAYLNQLMGKYPKTSTDHEVGRNAIGCPAGMEKIYITPYGDVLPCPFIHLSFGNVLSVPLEEIIKRMRAIPEFNQYQKICVAAEDIKFQENILSKIYSCGSSCPVPYEKIYGKTNGQ